MKGFSIIASAFALSFAITEAEALTIIESSGSLESAYAEWEPVSGASSYNVYYSGNGASNVQIDDALIRGYGTYFRADIPGLSAGSYTIKVVPVSSGSEGTGATTSALTVKAQDRAGFAFTSSHVPGAYNSDGTLKSGAVVIYITENNKNTVSFDVTTNTKGTTTTCTGLQPILDAIKKGYETRPIVFRLIGNITDPETLLNGDIVIENGNSESSYVTLEGVGDDATVNGWGIRLKNATNVEVRNLGIMNVNSGEGDNIGLQQGNTYIWVHNCDFFYGDAGSDADQKKGDGALDCKKSNYITFSYNHFWDNGKSNLLGLSEGIKSYQDNAYYITYHHNWYDHSDSRHPRVRYYNAHVYNNYYDGNAKYGAGSTLGSSVFMEANYFRNCKYPMLTSEQGSDLYAGGTKRDEENGTFSSEDGGTIKAYNNTMEGTYTFIPYGATSYTANGSTVTASAQGITTTADFDAYVVTSRSATVPSSITSYQGANYYSNFDTDSGIMYSYTADSPETAKTNVTTYAGRVNGGDFKWTFTNSNDDTSSAVDETLKSDLTNYTSTLVSVQGEGVIVTSSSSTTSSSSAVSSSSAASSSSTPSSSSAASSSSTASSSSAGTGTISADIVHNFTTDGTTSSYFAITGNLSTSKGTVEYGGLTLMQCLKMESSTSIVFTLEKAATITLVFNSDFSGSVAIGTSSENTSYTATAGIVTAELAAGTYTIQKDEAAYLYLIAISFTDTDPTGIRLATDAEAGIHFSNADNRLTVNAASVLRIQVIRTNGTFAMRSSSGEKSVNLSKLPTGVYIVRAVTNAGVLQRTIYKR